MVDIYTEIGWIKHVLKGKVDMEKLNITVFHKVTYFKKVVIHRIFITNSILTQLRQGSIKNVLIFCLLVLFSSNIWGNIISLIFVFIS